YSSALALQGLLPATTLAVALSPDGTRAYTYDSAAAAVLVFDISATNNATAYPQLGSAVALPGSPGSSVRMILSLDGKTLFIAGTTQLVVLPTP
ncbi:MAG: hypothetical protein ACJ8MR_17800, partial [Povalibacter sp.]